MSEITRTEKFLRACIDGVPCELKPLTRVEKLLAELNETLAGPAPVVILPETELTYEESEDGFFLYIPWESDPVEGGMYKVTYNGTDYECEGLPSPGGAPEGTIGMGNLTLFGVSGGNADAPFALMCYTTAIGADAGFYAALIPADGATSVTLSIVQTEGASADSGSGGGGVFIVPATTADMQSVTVDKTPDEAMAAAQAGQHVECHLTMSVGEMTITYILPLVYFGDLDYGPVAHYGMYMSGKTLEIEDGYTGTGERATEISMTEA